MDNVQRQAILAILGSIDAQTKAIRTMLALEGAQAVHVQQVPDQAPSGYTSDAEDAEIERAFSFNEQKDQMLHDIFKSSQETDGN